MIICTLCELCVACSVLAGIREEVGEGRVEGVARQVCVQGFVDDLYVCGDVLFFFHVLGGVLDVLLVGGTGLENYQRRGEPLKRSH